MTDATFGYATAMDIATETIDRLHSTAHSHHRIIVAEIMGHRAGWLTLGSGIAGGADVILIPEIPYDVEKIAEAIKLRSKHGTNFSIVAVAEGAMSRDDARAFDAAEKKIERAKTLHDKKESKSELASLEVRHQGNTLRLAKQLEELTHLESRLTILGYVQRGGTPSAADRILATRLGSACGDLINEGVFGVMVAARGEGTEPVPLEKVAGKRKAVPPAACTTSPPAKWSSIREMICSGNQRKIWVFNLFTIQSMNAETQPSRMGRGSGGFRLGHGANATGGNLDVELHCIPRTAAAVSIEWLAASDVVLAQARQQVISEIEGYLLGYLSWRSSLVRSKL